MIKKLVTGSQTGVNRGALDVALEKDFPYYGWCPKGRISEDGPLNKKYSLNQAKSHEERIAMELNIIEADGTLVLTLGRPTGCTAMAGVIARRRAKPLLIVDLVEVHNKDTAVHLIKKWILDYKIEVVNIVGPKKSQCPGIYEDTKAIVGQLI